MGERGVAGKELSIPGRVRAEKRFAEDSVFYDGGGPWEMKTYAAFGRLMVERRIVEDRKAGRKVQVFGAMRLGRRTATQATLSTGSQATADDEVESGKARAFCQAPPATDQPAAPSR